MAVNSSRSMTRSLDEGATDGTYRKVRVDTEPNALNTAEMMRARQSLHPFYNYGFLTTDYPNKVNQGK